MVEIKEAKNQTDIMGMTPCGKGKLLKINGKTVEVQGKPFSGHVGLTVAIYVSIEGYKNRIMYDGKQLHVFKYRLYCDDVPFWDRLMSVNEAKASTSYKEYVEYLVKTHEKIQEAI